MDRRTLELVKKAQIAKMTKEACAIATAKNPASQWGVDAKKEAKKGTTATLDNTDALKKGIATDKNPAAQWGAEEKKASKDALLDVLVGMTKQAKLEDIKNSAKMLADKVATKTKEVAGKGVDLAKAHPMVASAVGGGLLGSALGTGIGGAIAGGKGAARGAVIGAGAGVLGGPALQYLMQKMHEKQQNAKVAGDFTEDIRSNTNPLEVFKNSLPKEKPVGPVK